MIMRLKLLSFLLEHKILRINKHLLKCSSYEHAGRITGYRVTTKQRKRKKEHVKKRKCIQQEKRD